MVSEITQTGHKRKSKWDVYQVKLQQQVPAEKEHCLFKLDTHCLCGFLSRYSVDLCQQQGCRVATVSNMSWKHTGNSVNSRLNQSSDAFEDPLNDSAVISERFSFKVANPPSDKLKVESVGQSRKYELRAVQKHRIGLHEK